eukprot:CAMPEP_0178989300 /NCGR_PEP_ID=MMETSP0795-20121207/4282_1 /TAXON_ID=88552 /ORGANISM="Amoebophrya sp., Strain Ameob2" /LENGTH=44 /DNA_ID= /DNA_START= /DNA_END= /DNA_ORIENTATION=
MPLAVPQLRTEFVHCTEVGLVAHVDLEGSIYDHICEQLLLVRAV